MEPKRFPAKLNTNLDRAIFVHRHSDRRGLIGAERIIFSRHSDRAQWCIRAYPSSYEHTVNSTNDVPESLLLVRWTGRALNV